MAELADAQDLGSCEEIRVGSTPTTRTSSSQASYRLRRAFSFYCKAHRVLILLLLASRPQPLCWIAAWGCRFAAVLFFARVRRTQDRTQFAGPRLFCPGPQGEAGKGGAHGVAAEGLGERGSGGYLTIRSAVGDWGAGVCRAQSLSFRHKTSCALAYHNEKQNQRRMKFLGIISGYPEGARKWRISEFCYAFA